MSFVILDLLHFGNNVYEGATSSPYLSLLASLLGAIISGSIAILNFNRGIKKQRAREAEKEDERLSYLKTHFITLIKNSVIDIKSQVNSFKEYAERTLQEPLEIAPLQQKILEDLKRALQKDTNDIQRIFDKNGISSEDYSSFYKSIDFLNIVINKAIVEIYEINDTQIHPLATKVFQLRSDILQKIVDEMVNIKNLETKGDNEDKYYKLYNEVLEKYYRPQDGVEANIKYDYNTLFTPLSERLLEMGTFEEGSGTLLKLCKTAKDVSFTIQSINKQNAHSIFQIIPDIVESIENAERILKNLE